MTNKVDIKSFILASNSKRRRDILLNRGYSFKIIPSSFEYDITNKQYDRNLLIECAKQKAFSVAKDDSLNNSLIVSCDTIVIKDNIIIGKPKDRDSAYNTLKSLSSSKHFVETCVFILHNVDYTIENDACDLKYKSYLYDIGHSEIEFRDLSDYEIYNYIDNYNPYDKEGSYGIQDNGFDFVLKVNGDINNIIGLPIDLFESLIYEFVDFV